MRIMATTPRPGECISVGRTRWRQPSRSHSIRYVTPATPLIPALYPERKPSRFISYVGCLDLIGGGPRSVGDLFAVEESPDDRRLDREVDVLGYVPGHLCGANGVELCVDHSDDVAACIHERATGIARLHGRSDLD